MLKDMQECRAKRKELGLNLLEAARGMSIDNHMLSAYEKINKAPAGFFEKYCEYLENYDPNEVVIYASDKEVKYVPYRWVKDLSIFRELLKLRLKDIAAEVNINPQRLNKIINRVNRMTHFEYENIAQCLISHCLRGTLGDNFRSTYKHKYSKNN